MTRNVLRFALSLFCAAAFAGQTNISIGTAANDNTGDSLRTAFIKVNTNFTEIYTALRTGGFLLIGSTNSTLTNAVTLAPGAQVYFTTNGTEIQIHATGGGEGAAWLFNTDQFEVVSSTNVYLKSGTLITNATLYTPTITSFASSTHSHESEAGGGSLNTAALGAGTLDNARLAATVTLDAEWDTSAEIIAKVGDETGSGALVFGTTPTITTPVLVAPSIASFASATHNHTSAETGGLLADTFQPINASLTALANNPLLYQATNTALTALATTPTMYQATNNNLTLLGAYGPTTWQATNANLTALATDPTIYQATNANLTLWAAVTPSSYSAGGLTEATASALYQATNANLTALATDPTIYQATNAALTTLAGKTLSGSGNIPLTTLPSITGAQLTSPTLITPKLTNETADRVLWSTSADEYQGITTTANTSANLAASISDETGTGKLVLDTSPAIVTPTISSFINANHNHTTGAGGGQIGAAGINAADSYTMGALDVTGAFTADNASVTNAFTAGTIGTTANPDIDAAFTAKLDASSDLGDIADAVVAWTESKTFDDLTFRQAASYSTTNIIGTTHTIEFTGPPIVRMNATGDVTIALGTLPDDDTYIGRTIWLAITNSQSTNVLYTGPEITSRSFDNPSGVVSQRFLDLFFHWDGTNATYWWSGPQDGQLTTDAGGTGNTNGVADAPLWVIHTPTSYGGTGSNVWDAELSRGTKVYLNSETNVFIGEVAGVPAAGLERFQDWRVSNTNATDRWRLDFNPSWITAGFDSPHYITNGTYAYFRLSANTLGTYVDNLRPTTVGVVGGGGSAPASTLFDDIVANWKFEETTGSTVADEVGSLDLAEFNGAWTKNVTGINGVAWTNVSNTRVLTNDSTSLELGRSGASFTVAAWVVPQYAAYTRLFGEWHDTTSNPDDFSWLLLTSATGYLQYRCSSDGDNEAVAATSTFQLADNTRCLVAFKFDNTGNVVGVSKDGEPWQATAFTGDMFDAAVHFHVGGYFKDGLPNGSRGQFDEMTVWDVALTDAQISEHWNGGTGSFYTP